MMFLLVIALALYALPLLAVASAAFAQLLGTESSFAYVTTIAAVVQFYQEYVAVPLGNIITPGVTAASLTPQARQATVPRATKVVLVTFALLLVVVAATYAQLSAHAVAFQEYGSEISKTFNAFVRSDGAQIMTFLALAGGITVKSRSGS